jgi:signal transduction histidine kinase/ActR/RegA family two-component response regulator
MTMSPGFGGHFSQRFVRLVAATGKVVGLGVLVLRGSFPQVLDRYFPMSTLEALCLLFLASGLLFQSFDPRNKFFRGARLGFSLLALSLGLAALLGVPYFASAMTFAAAACVALLAIVIAFPDFEPWPGTRPLQILLLPVMWAGFLSAVARMYGASTANLVTSVSAIPLPSAVAFLLLTMGTLCARPRAGIMGVVMNEHVGGVMARILLPVIVVLPFTVGWLRLQGNRLGYYDSYFGSALFSTTNISVFIVFIWLTARTLNHIDGKRRKALETVQEGNAELTRLNASLEARIRQHYVAEEARKKAEMQLFQSQKMEALGTLASGIAHDFNNILTIMILNADLAGEALDPGHPARQNLGEIGKAGKRAADLIRQIMTFGQRNESELKTLRIEKVIQDAVGILQRSLPPGIRVACAFQGGSLPAVNANQTHIEQVLINLGANAAHAMGKEGGSLDIHLEAVTITAEKAALSAQLREGSYVRVTVSDSGHGMDAHTLKNIFDPFFTTKAPGEGTGLGLSVVHGIMKLHGGAITVYSEPGRGTVFTLYFPAAGELRPAGAPPPAELPRGNGEHVLCVDDDESLVAAVSTLLIHLGYRTTVHRYPREAIEDFRSHPGKYDLVLTDFSMPELSGLTLARTFAALQPGIPIVMMSGYLRPEDAEEAGRAGVHEVLLKPDVPEKLGQIIHRRLAMRASTSGTALS